MPALPSMLAERIELWDLGQLVPYSQNPREHSPDQIRRIAASISQFGFLQPILVDRSSREIIAGHGRLEAARLLGLPRVPVVPLEHLSEAHRRAYLVADNRLAELSTWNEEKLRSELAALSAQLPELPELGFDAGKLRRILAPARAAPADVDQIEETSEISVPTARLGDLWFLGDHRLACGDSGDKGVRDLALGGKAVDCVLTDPPYAIFGSSTGVSSEVADDRMVAAFFSGVLRSIASSLKLGGHAYVFCDWRSWASWWQGARGSGLAIANRITWDKGDFGLGANYRNNTEDVVFLHRTKAKTSLWDTTPKGARPVHEPNIIRNGRTGVAGFEREKEPGERYHNAAKPVDLLGRFLGNSTDQGERVLDLFCGAGSTILAAELAQRRGVGIEIEPRWIDVSIRRWEKLTGKTATLQGGGTFAEIALERRAALDDGPKQRRRRAAKA